MPLRALAGVVPGSQHGTYQCCCVHDSISLSPLPAATVSAMVTKVIIATLVTMLGKTAETLFQINFYLFCSFEAYRCSSRVAHGQCLCFYRLYWDIAYFIS
jgi:hypothetical protein